MTQTLTTEAAREVLVEVLCQIAPDIDDATLDDDTDLYDDLGLDSMDVLNLADGLNARTGVEVPEIDYPRLSTVGAAARYLSDRTGGS